jgi:hypothetical protein
MLATLEPVLDDRRSDGDPAAGSQAAKEPAAELEGPPAIGLFQNIPSGIWITFLAAWATFFGLMVLFFATSREAAFMITIVVLFGLMAFGLPLALGAQAKCDKYDCKGVVQTLTGPLSVRAAAMQIALIPIAVVIGLSGFILLAK